VANPWGVDSFNRADKPDASNDPFWRTDPFWKDQAMPTLYDYVVIMTSRQPDFWGRYINGAVPLTSEEVDYLRSKECSILCIFSLERFANARHTHSDAGTNP
jgi:hypothetical protein